MKNHKVVLMILDGWGIGNDPKVSAIEAAKTPFVDSLFEKYPHSKLEASGISVGLPKGQMGNSEVGHMNIGAGRIVYQDLMKINNAISNNTLEKEPSIVASIKYAKDNAKKIHLMGLVSDGGVHAHIDHLKALCDIFDQNDLPAFIHAFTDGRDTDSKGGVNYIDDLQTHIKDKSIKIASLIGRYYAMDRDNRWERVKLAYDLLVKGQGTPTTDLIQSIKKSYDDGITDEFVKPLVCVNENNQPLATVEKGDVVICFNFRTDRGRQITQALTQEDFHKDFPVREMPRIPLYYVTLTNYDATFKDIKVVFNKENLKNTLGEVIAKHGKKQIRIAETEKNPHVTFFFSGGRNDLFDGEQRILCPSPKVPTYDQLPEMSAKDIQESICKELEKEVADFVCLNFANPDMVGHTGVFEAVVKACETVDTCTKKVVETALEHDYTCIIIADHGNADFMINQDGTPHTAHTTNLVPCILINDDKNLEIKDGILGDLAPTILQLMGLPKPPEMSRNSLLN